MKFHLCSLIQQVRCDDRLYEKSVEEKIEQFMRTFDQKNLTRQVWRLTLYFANEVLVMSLFLWEAGQEDLVHETGGKASMGAVVGDHHCHSTSTSKWRRYARTSVQQISEWENCFQLSLRSCSYWGCAERTQRLVQLEQKMHAALARILKAWSIIRVCMTD